MVNFSFQNREILVLELSVWAVYKMFMLHLKCLREKVDTLSAMLESVVLIKINNVISQGSWLNRFCCMTDCYNILPFFLTLA